MAYTRVTNGYFVNNNGQHSVSRSDSPLYVPTTKMLSLYQLLKARKLFIMVINNNKKKIQNNIVSRYCSKRKFRAISRPSVISLKFVKGYAKLIGTISLSNRFPATSPLQNKKSIIEYAPHRSRRYILSCSITKTSRAIQSQLSRVNYILLVMYIIVNAINNHFYRFSFLRTLKYYVSIVRVQGYFLQLMYAHVTQKYKNYAVNIFFDVIIYALSCIVVFVVVVVVFILFIYNFRNKKLTKNVVYKNIHSDQKISVLKLLLLKVAMIKIYYDCNTTHIVVQLQRSQIRQNNAYHRKFNLFAALYRYMMDKTSK
ncbi:hypothetical protein AGLY_005102 [Aphis glycines]|uniref:Transmembrane protein n=1 Tax=Aphis glycines TaxID=307491 RepID=A0A6G0TW93_APHGL|nr:hypothetical protein AGLY_005102 [Aphis glycines]